MLQAARWPAGLKTHAARPGELLAQAAHEQREAVGGERDDVHVRVLGDDARQRVHQRAVVGALRVEARVLRQQRLQLLQRLLALLPLLRLYLFVVII